MTYSEKLKDPRWQKKRLEVLEYAHFRCQICGAKNRTLHCHHSYYTRGKEPWQYPGGAIISVCDKCHEKLHPKAAPRPASPSDPGYITPPEQLPLTPAEKAQVRSRFGALRAAVEKATENERMK